MTDECRDGGVGQETYHHVHVILKDGDRMHASVCPQRCSPSGGNNKRDVIPRDSSRPPPSVPGDVGVETARLVNQCRVHAAALQGGLTPGRRPGVTHASMILCADPGPMARGSEMQGSLWCPGSAARGINNQQTPH